MVRSRGISRWRRPTYGDSEKLAEERPGGGVVAGEKTALPSKATGIKFSHLFANKFGYVLTSRKMCLKNFNSASWKKKEGFKILCFHAVASLSLCLKDFCTKALRFSS
ncbi:hypothetical protein ACFX2F_005776 [Malus domestica]